LFVCCVYKQYSVIQVPHQVHLLSSCYYSDDSLISYFYNSDREFLLKIEMAAKAGAGTITSIQQAAEPPDTGNMCFASNKPLIPSGRMPSGRGGASTVCADGKLIVFGGHYLAGAGTYTYLDETWLFDVDKLTWHKMTCTGQLPGPRYGHSAHIFGSRMFVFGGKGPGDTVYKDLYFLDLIEWIWVAVNPISRGPSPRYVLDA
jgi:hypothetical protein